MFLRAAKDCHPSLQAFFPKMTVHCGGPLLEAVFLATLPGHYSAYIRGM